MIFSTVAEQHVGCRPAGPILLSWGKEVRMRHRGLALLPIAAMLAASGLLTTAPAATPAIAGGPPTPAAVPVASIESEQPWINTVAPKFDDDRDAKVPATRAGTKKSALDKAWDYEKTYTGGNPKAARQLASIEQKAVKAHTNPRQIKQAKSTQTAKLLTILVEFNPDAQRRLQRLSRCRPACSATGPAWRAPSRAARSTTTSRTRPTRPPRTTTRIWVDDFSPEHFDRMLYTSEGITERVRTRPHRPRREARHRHLGLHDAEPLPRDVQGRVHGRW